nr:hypothetical protein CFP56_69026 [Quercus suber]
MLSASSVNTVIATLLHTEGPNEAKLAKLVPLIIQAISVWGSKEKWARVAKLQLLKARKNALKLLADTRTEMVNRAALKELKIRGIGSVQNY